MLYAIAGSQGSGKSTLIKSLKDEHQYKAIKRNTSRSILSDWKLTLTQINNNPEYFKKFQMEISKRKEQDEATAETSPNVWLTERTYFDSMAYSVASLGTYPDCSKWLDEYFIDCLHKMKVYNHVFYLVGGLFPIQEDGVRNTNKQFSMMIDSYLLKLLTSYCDHTKLTIIDASNIYYRTQIVHNIITNGDNR